MVGAGDAVVKCFSDDDVEGGRAFALTNPGVVHGIAPDGACRVTLEAGGKTVTADVHENAYEIRVPVAAGEQVRLGLERLHECRPAAELLDAVPALRDGAWQELPGEMPSAGGSWVAQPCATARELRGGTWLMFKGAGDPAIVGMAPPGTHGVQLLNGGRVHDMPFTGGVFGGLVPRAFERPDEVRYLR